MGHDRYAFDYPSSSPAGNRNGGTSSGISSLEPKLYRGLNADPRRLSNDDNYTYTEKRSTYREEKNPCLSWVRYGIFAANIVFIVVGIAVLALGSWLRTDSRFRDFLSERYRNAVEEAFWEAPTLYAFSYIMIVLGASMIVVAFFGCCGVSASAKLFLGLYAFSVFVLFTATVSAGIYLFYKKDGIDVELSDALNYMVQHYYQGPGIVQESLDRLQQTFRCCGNSGCADFRQFRQDPPRTCDIRCDGCHYRIWQALTIGFSATLVVFFFVILMQLLAFVLALYLLIRPVEQVRVLYISNHSNAAYQSSPPSTHPVALTRDALDRHNLSAFAMKKYRAARSMGR